MTPEIKCWREVLHGIEAQLVYFEHASRKKGSTAENKAEMRHKLAATTTARDAITKKLTKIMEDAEQTP